MPEALREKRAGSSRVRARVRRIDFDCVLDAKPDLPPEPAAAEGYLLANAYLALQGHVSDRNAFDVGEFVQATRLIEHPKDRNVVYVVASILFFAAATRPNGAEQYEPCAKKIAFKAKELGYEEAFWITYRNESLLSARLPSEVRCEIPLFNAFLENM